MISSSPVAPVANAASEGQLVWVDQGDGCWWPGFIDADSVQPESGEISVGYFPITLSDDTSHFNSEVVARERIAHPFEALFARYSRGPETGSVKSTFSDAVQQAAEEALITLGGDVELAAQIGRLRNTAARAERFCEIFDQMAAEALRTVPEPELEDETEDYTAGEYDSDETDDDEDVHDKPRSKVSVEVETIPETEDFADAKCLHKAVLSALRCSKFRSTTVGQVPLQRGRAWARRTISMGVVRRRRSGMGCATATLSKPRLSKLVVTLARQLGIAEYSSVYITNNVMADMHCDVNNAGSSWIIALGDFSGGDIYAKQWGERHWKCHDIQCCDDLRVALRFDGNSPHATCPFDGERFVIIYYTHRQCHLLPVSEQATLTRMGFLLPATSSPIALARKKHTLASLHSHECRKS